MNVVVSPRAAKFLKRLNEPQKGLIIKALDSNDAPVVETDLTEEEKAIIRAGREEYKAGGHIPLAGI